MKPRSFRRIPLREHEGSPHEAPSKAGESASGAPALLDLSSTTHCYGPSTALLRTLRDAVDRLQAYPEPTGATARSAVARRFGTHPDRVVLGHGACELLWTCARVLVRPEDTVLLVEPGYAELGAAVRQIGARVVKWHAVERTGHRIDAEQLGELMSLERPGIVGLCSPNSPTGVSLPMEQINALAGRFPDTYFIVDQSLLALSDDFTDLELLPQSNVVCVRSMGKQLALSGLRAGYILADAALAVHFESTRPSYSTGTLAQLAIERGVTDDAHLSRCRSRLQEDRTRLGFSLGKLELTATPSVAPFLLVRMTRAADVARDLLSLHHIAVHECSQYGLPDHLRISALPADAEKRFTAALREVMERRKLHKGRDA
jgi:histidinol-phosphate/aromatic aminotransferase/cobyric acid decarboxylase-like protein